MSLIDKDGYPATPSEAAEFFMERFRAYLPERERAELGKLVEEWGMAWGDLTSSVAAESGPR